MLQEVEVFDSNIPTINRPADDVQPVDGEYEALLGSYYPEGEEGALQQILSKPYFASGYNISAEELEALANEDNTDTTWETELREHRMKRWASLLKCLVPIWQPKLSMLQFSVIIKQLSYQDLWLSW
jgi:hypothetical protein